MCPLNQEVTSENVDYLQLDTELGARRIAYIRDQGRADHPGLFWLSGFKSSMLGEKAQALAAWAKEHGCSSTRLDYSAHGLSEGKFEEGTISLWLEDALTVFTQLSEGPQIIVGSSMGGWITLLLTRLVPKDRLKAIILIAPAWDMTEQNMWLRFSDEIRETILTNGFYARPSAYGDGDYIITKKLIDDGRKHQLIDEELHYGCPIHILHGRQDPDVPWTHGERLLTLLPHDDVNFTLIPDGDHRLSRQQDIDLLLRTVEQLATL